MSQLSRQKYLGQEEKNPENDYAAVEQSLLGKESYGMMQNSW